MSTITKRLSVLNLFKTKKKPTEYHYIQNFENADDKMCKKYDKDNDRIYERNCALYTKTKRFLEKNNAIFKMDGPPDPPRVPSNYELYIIHKNRNSYTNNKIQTISILYLLQHDYTLIIDPDVKFIHKVMNKENKLFEPYMAIDIASSLNKNFINDLSKSYKFNGNLIENPELLSLNEFKKNGVIKYIDNNIESSVVDTTQLLQPDTAIEQTHTATHIPNQPIPSAPESPVSLVSHTQHENECIYPLLNTKKDPPAYTSNNLIHKQSTESFGDEGGINIFINKNN